MIRRTVAGAGVLAALLAGACVPPVPPRAGPTSAASPSAIAPAGEAVAAASTPAVVASLPVASPRPAATATARPPAMGPASCPLTLASQLASTGAASQLVTVVASSYGSTTAQVTLWERSGGCWVLQAGPWPGWLGASGLSDHHTEGDGTTPTGAYGIGPVMYGLASDPGVRYRYHLLACGDWWDEDPASPTYNTFQHAACNTDPPFKGGSEALWKATTAYQHFAVVTYNTKPVVAGAGSAIFIHDDTGRPTIGCVSVAAANLDHLLRWLDPARSPLVAIGTDAEIRRF